MVLSGLVAAAFGFLENAALLALGVLGACRLRSWLAARMRPPLTALLFGLLLGGVGILAIIAATVTGQGSRLDLRNAIVLIATLYGGFRAGAVSLLVLAAFRMSLGGDGMLVGLAGMAISYGGAAVGLITQRRRGRRLRLPEVALLTLVTELVFAALLSPPLPPEILTQMVLAWLTAVTAAAAFLASIIINDEHRDELLRSLTVSEGRFRALIEHSTDSLRVLTAEGRVRERYRTAPMSLGYSEEEALGCSIFDVAHPDDAPELRKRLDEILASPGAQRSGRVRLRHRNGGWRVVAWSARNALAVPGVEGIILNGRDETEASRLEEQLRQSQKMEAVGRLAGGIAHDFNNLLGGIMGFVGFLLEDLPRDSEQWRFAKRIKTASERARDLVAQILAFSRLKSVERAPVDLVRLAREAHDLLRASLPSSTELDFATEADRLVIDGDQAQIAQILLNLCVNANDALGGRPGHITLRLSCADPERHQFAFAGLDHAESEATTNAGWLAPGRRYARIEVTDSGSGMDEETMRQIFDPFYTTKPTGQGTGLGLSVVHGIVTGYEGACLVRSELGKGTCFAVYLPLSEAVAEAPRRERPARRSGRGRILLVDDEALMRDSLEIGLARLGYAVTALGDSEQALAQFERTPDAWDLVISDHAMPRMLGLTFIERLRAIRASLPCFLCSGYADDGIEEQARALGVRFFVKPISAEQLGAVIRELTPEGR